jgi:hypothetical protein
MSDRNPGHGYQTAHFERAGRAANETIVKRWGELADAGRALFRCECAMGTCLAAVWLPLGIYDAVRRDPTRFVIHPGHDLPDVDEVVARGPGYAIVRKRADVPVRPKRSARISLGS